MGSESPAQIQRGREQELNRKNVYFLENVEFVNFFFRLLKIEMSLHLLRVTYVTPI